MQKYQINLLDSLLQILRDYVVLQFYLAWKNSHTQSPIPCYSRASGRIELNLKFHAKNNKINIFVCCTEHNTMTCYLWSAGCTQSDNNNHIISIKVIFPIPSIFCIGQLMMCRVLGMTDDHGHLL